MKKVLYSVAIVAALGLASCGAKTEEKTTEGAPKTEQKENVDSAATKCCTEGQECTNEECNKDGKCEEACCPEAGCTEAGCPEAGCPEANK